ncbi:MAG: calcium-binding protein, partial [Actinomycetota bacterium]|nr:calcium-binding protein [Actinomycetota bacterium]
MTRITRPLIALAALALALPASASAATVAVVDGKPTFTAASGEANVLTVSIVTGGVRFEDDGISSVTAGSGCTAPAGKRVDCLLAVVPGVVVDAGDGNDEVYVNLLAPSTVYGGLGNDVLRGGGVSDTMDGGPGNDSLDGIWGNDVLIGAEGADVLEGGSGRDRVSYAERTAGVAASLDDVANDGGAGEGDNVRPSVEDVTGGSGSDALTGDADANELLGGAGDDVLDGGDGDDVLDGGAGT